MKKYLLILLTLTFFSPNSSFAHGDHPPAEEKKEDFKRGPHNGRLLEHEDFQVEVSIYEPEGTPPKFRIYFYENGKPLNPSDIGFTMRLTRINRVEQIPFKQRDDYLESTVDASEPHSFQVAISATRNDKTYNWEYESYEGRVELTPESIESNQIKIEEAGPVNLEITLDVTGKILPDDELTLYVSPRFPGIVKAVHKKLGDSVAKGDTLAVIESNESLQNYEVHSEINGVVIKKNISVGMHVAEHDNIFIIADLSSVWADFTVYQQDLSQLKIGDPVVVTCLDGSMKQQSTISYISPIGDAQSQSVIARSILSNVNGYWKPGLFLSGKITLETVPVAVAIKDSALQTYRDWDVVFISKGNTFEVAPVKLGKRNKEWIEIKSGLQPGDHYVSENSFIPYADLEKSGATHEH